MLGHRENVRTSKLWQNLRKRSEIFCENLPREYKVLIFVKKIKITSCLCTFKEIDISMQCCRADCEQKRGKLLRLLSIFLDNDI